MEEEDTGQAGPVVENLSEPDEPLSPAVEAGEVVEDEADGDGFSFPVPPVAADACIVPVYPIFGRTSSPPLREEEEEEEEQETATVRVPLGRLLLEERESRARELEQDGRSASARRAWQEDDEDLELEGVPPETYCLWAPGGGGGGGGQSSAPASPRRCRKSGSTGSVLRWRRISDRLVGRSHSDGKEKFVFLTAATAVPEPPRRSIKEEEEGGGINKAGDAGSVAHQLRYYGKGGGGSGSRRRSYLPYKQELVGLFANVSGLRRSYHPF